MRGVFALLILGCACGRGLSVHVENDAGFVPDAGTAACDVLEQNCPGATDACYPQPVGASICAAVGRQGEGAPCALSTECLPSMACSGGGQSVCHRICVPNGSTNTCAEGQSCSALAPFGLCTPPGSYSACVYSGGLDHITLRHSEPARNLCTVISLSSPGNNTLAALSVPSNWEVQSVSIARVLGGCPLGFGTPSGLFAQNLSGRIELFVPDGGYLPTRAEAFLNISPSPDSGAPQDIVFLAAQLLLGDCF